MSQKKKQLSENDKTRSSLVNTNADYANTDNQIPGEVEEEFFPEPKKHPDTQYLD